MLRFIKLLTQWFRDISPNSNKSKTYKIRKQAHFDPTNCDIWLDEIYD